MFEIFISGFIVSFIVKEFSIGRSGQYNPHIHVIMSSGELNFISYDLLHKKWQYYLLNMIKEKVKEEGIEKLIDEMYIKYPKGFVANVSKGGGTSKSKRII